MTQMAELLRILWRNASYKRAIPTTPGQDYIGRALTLVEHRASTDGANNKLNLISEQSTLETPTQANVP
jgi:hypothetical protein